MMQLDKRTREDIIHEMEELAGSYTPEWKFRTRQGDAGSALLNIYSDMLVELLRQYNQIPERDRQRFFQMLGTRQRPAEPAGGYVSFGLAHPETEGTVVAAGTGLWGTGEDGKPVKLETQKEIYISNNQLGPVMYQDGERDQIYCLTETEGKFSAASKENLQEHVCCLGHSTVFHIGEDAELLITFQPRRESRDWDALIGDREKTGFSYSSGGREWQFETWSCHSHTIRLKKTKEMPDFEAAGGEEEACCSIRWRAKDIRAYTGLELTDIRIGAVCPAMSPDYVYTAEEQEGRQFFFPFGERPYSHGECYICANEVFEKRGAMIHLSLDMEFRKLPLLQEPVPLPIHWKTIMKQSDFPKTEELPVTIGEVVWEYYNGTGFTRLFTEPLYTHIFSPPIQDPVDSDQSGIRSEQISFLCPKDIVPFLVNAETVYCIRIRILRMQHEYTVNGYYLSPFITHMEVSYDYRDFMQEPEHYRCCNNLEEQRYTGRQPVIPFQPQPEPRPGIYIGFSKPLTGGPYGIYCEVEEGSALRSQKQWNYEYYDGREWSSLVLEDGTENLTKSGILMPFGNYNMRALRLFGTERYWLRLIRQSSPAVQEEPIPLQEIWMNTVSVLAVEQAPEEYLTLPEAEGCISCPLKQKNIQQIQVWVNEAYLSREEQEELEQKTEVHRIRNEAGMIVQVWVLWKEAEDIRSMQPDTRFYCVERQEGILGFSCGKQGFLRGNRRENQVKAVYTWGGGSRGNLREGQVTHISRSIRFLNQVVNHHRLFGGREEELPEEASARMERQLLHRNRAVMRSDYEALALESTREVKRVKAFSNRNGMGERQQGAITLVVLQEEYGKKEFQTLKERIYEYIRSRMPGIRQVQRSFFIVEPWFTEIQVTAVCRIRPQDSVFACKAEAEERLDRFLNPLTGNSDGKGWKIGQAPCREQIRHVLHKTRGICQLQRMVVKAYCQRNGRLQEINLEGTLPEFLMVINGSYRFQMVLDNGRREGEDA